MRVLTLTRPDPSALLSRIAEGDEAAVAQCVAAFGGMVLVLARRWSTDAADAEDAVQEVFFDLWKHAGRYDPAKASERGFVAMIARRRLIDRLRKRSREVPMDGIPDGFDLPDESEDQGERVAGAMDARAALEQLTPMQRRFIERHLLDGKTHDEIARESQVPLGTVKSHIRRGLLKARALLTGRVERTQEDEP
jgi:RNA polymerase sigma-70 factor, ECF subfamily